MIKGSENYCVKVLSFLQVCTLLIKMGFAGFKHQMNYEKDRYLKEILIIFF